MDVKLFMFCCLNCVFRNHHRVCEIINDTFAVIYGRQKYLYTHVCRKKEERKVQIISCTK